jgi:uncharacterized protein YigA (DUF484 family)
LTGKTRTASEEPGNNELTDATVRDYLKDNPDFFERHPDMLDHLKQVSVLRERNMEMRKRLNSLTGNARDNDRLYDLTRKLVLNLLESANLEELGERFVNGLREDFGVEHASLILFGDPGQSSPHCRVEPADRARIEIGALIKGQNAVCGTLRPEELRYLFPTAGNVGSAAVVPLVKGGDLGLIAVGSDDPNHYSATMGTLFLNHLGEVLVRLVPRLGGDLSRE